MVLGNQKFAGDGNMAAHLRLLIGRNAGLGGVGFALRVLENHNGVAIRASSDALVVFRIGNCLHGFVVDGGAY